MHKLGIVMLIFFITISVIFFSVIIFVLLLTHSESFLLCTGHWKKKNMLLDGPFCRFFKLKKMRGKSCSFDSNQGQQLSFLTIIHFLSKSSDLWKNGTSILRKRPESWEMFQVGKWVKVRITRGDGCLRPVGSSARISGKCYINLS